MWAEAAKWLRKFGDEAVLTVLDSDGYPGSVRVDSTAYDATSGELRVAVPEALRPSEGPASLMCHYHDEKMWNIKVMHIKGRLENRAGTWVFVSTGFDAPSRLAMFYFIKGARTASQKYLDKRDLERPEVNWTEIKEIQRRIKR